MNIRMDDMMCFDSWHRSKAGEREPKEVHYEDFPSETFRVLKEKEVKQFGEYRTSRLVLEAGDGQGKG